jgi:hypothetical protein
MNAAEAGGIVDRTINVLQPMGEEFIRQTQVRGMAQAIICGILVVVCLGALIFAGVLALRAQKKGDDWGAFPTAAILAMVAFMLGLMAAIFCIDGIFAYVAPLTTLVGK